MARSKTVRTTSAAAPAPPPSPESLLKPRSWQGVVYRPLDSSGRAQARALLTYVAAWVPPEVPSELGWGAWVGRGAAGGVGDGAREAEGRAGDDQTPEGGAEKLVGAVILEPHGTMGMIHGPVVVDQPDPFEVASQLVAPTLPQATALGIERCFTRPQGLDRVWVRFGFIPVPEAELPTFFKGRPGTGLFAWRGGSALWSARAGPGDQ